MYPVTAEVVERVFRSADHFNVANYTSHNGSSITTVASFAEAVYLANRSPKALVYAGASATEEAVCIPRVAWGKYAQIWLETARNHKENEAMNLGELRAVIDDAPDSLPIYLEQNLSSFILQMKEGSSFQKRPMNGVNDMTPYEYLSSVLRELATSAAMGTAYPNWSDEFCRKEVREVWQDENAPLRKARIRCVTATELQALSKKQLTQLGFGRWSDELWVIPLWAWNYVADGSRLICITGNTVVKGMDKIDLDTRFGCVVYGFQLVTKN